MQDGERLVLEKVCALAITIENVPEVNPDAIERSWLCEAEMVTTCATSHALALAKEHITMDEFGLHVQVVVTANPIKAEKHQPGVGGKPPSLVNDLGPQLDLSKESLVCGPLQAHIGPNGPAGGLTAQPYP